jgi:hypothetical protein
MYHSSNGLEYITAPIATEIIVATGVGHHQPIATVIRPTCQRPNVVCDPINLN